MGVYCVSFSALLVCLKICIMKYRGNFLKSVEGIIQRVMKNDVS